MWGNSFVLISKVSVKKCPLFFVIITRFKTKQKTRKKMKKSIMSLVAIASISSSLMAGGDIVPVEAVVIPVMASEVCEAKNTDRGVYLGVAYGAVSYDTNLESGELGTNNTYFDDVEYNSAMILAGYKFNQYIAVEGRYWFGAEQEAQDVMLNETFKISNDTWGFYAKPMYPITDKLDVYGLIGYASSDIEVTHPVYTYAPDTDMEGFSWGAGASYELTDSVAVFVDYTSMYDDEYPSRTTGGLAYSDTLNAYNFGATYKF